MSYWVYLQDHTAPPWCSYGRPDWTPEYTGDEQCTEPCYPAVSVEQHSEGGTSVLGGTTEASVSLTYNYGKYWWWAWQDIGGPVDGVGTGTLGSMIGGKTGAETIDPLEKVVAALGTERADDYWEATPGNAGYALSTLLSWAKQYPDAIWRVS